MKELATKQSLNNEESGKVVLREMTEKELNQVENRVKTIAGFLSEAESIKHYHVLAAMEAIKQAVSIKLKYRTRTLRNVITRNCPDEVKHAIELLKIEKPDFNLMQDQQDENFLKALDSYKIIIPEVIAGKNLEKHLQIVNGDIENMKREISLGNKGFQNLLL